MFHLFDLLHIDAKKLRRIVRPCQRVTDNRRDSVEGPVQATPFGAAADDRARIAFASTRPDEKSPHALLSLVDAMAYGAASGTIVRSVLTDTCPAFRSIASQRRMPGTAHHSRDRRVVAVGRLRGLSVAAIGPVELPSCAVACTPSAGRWAPKQGG